MKIQTMFRAALVPLCIAAASPSLLAADSSPARRAALPPMAGEVIVQFKSDASVLRSHALAARAGSGTVRNVLAQRAGSLGLRVGRALEAGSAVGERTQVVRASGIGAAELAALLRADPDVAFAEPNGRRRIAAAPNDPLYAAAVPGVRPRGPDAGQWYLRAPTADIKSSIGIEGAWASTRGNPGVVVAVLDTGVRFEHPDLGRVASGGRLLPGYDFVSEAAVGNDGNGRDDDPSDPGDWLSDEELAANPSLFKDCQSAPSTWHGTATASLVGAATDNGIGMAGTAPGVQVLPVRVLGKCFGTDADIQAAMLWSAGIAVAGVPTNPNPAQVINLSLGGSDTCSAGYRSVVEQVLARGVVIVASAGNDAGLAVGAPANCPGVIAVLGLRHIGTKVGFSDLGPEVSIAAPGGNCVNLSGPCLYPILSATNDGEQGPGGSGWTDSFNASVGTSFASPMVAATAGLMLSANAALTPGQVRTAMRSSARPFPTTGAEADVAQCRAPNGVEQLECYCTTALCGAGMLDAGAAVAAGIATPPPPPPPPPPVDTGGGGGGAMSAWWVLLLGAGALALRRSRTMR